MKTHPDHRTPFVLLNTSIIKQNIKLFEAGIPRCQIRYAMKSNPHPSVLKTVLESSAGFEIASSGELELLKKLKVEPGKIIFSAPVKKPDDIKEAFEYGVKAFVADCTQEVDKLAKYAPGSLLMVRVQADEEGSVFTLKEKFGAEPSETFSIIEYAASIGLKPIGLTFHVGSQAMNTEAWSKGLKTAHEIIGSVAKSGIKMNSVDIGGGFPFNYASGQLELDEAFKSIRGTIQQLEMNDLEILLEPGRALVANSMDLTTTVTLRSQRGSQNWVYLDAGTYNWVFEAMEFQGGLKFGIEQTDPRTDISSSFTVGGPTCDSIDVIRRNCLLPEDIKEGDRVVIRNVGAYSYSFGSSFNGFAVPQVYI